MVNLLHYIIVAICIALIIFYQIKVYLQTNKKREQFDNIFPSHSENEWAILKDEGIRIVPKLVVELKKQIEKTENDLEKVYNDIEKILSKISYHEEAQNDPDNFMNGILPVQQILIRDYAKRDELYKEKNKIESYLESLRERLSSQESKRVQNIGHTRSIIIDSINKYLDKNNAVTDFNLIRDIIDRNCDAVEEDIQTQIPIPLYFGLMGTMLGILVGVGALVLTGSLENLLTGDADSNAAGGISALFGGVALAMLSSIVGIFLTTIGSLKTKNIKIRFEGKKHAFISWLQAELLPKISSDFSSALIKLGNDLSNFNNTFSSNADLLRKTISDVSQATVAQSNLLKNIERLDVAKIANANIHVYESLKNCRDEISTITNDLKSIQESIQGVGQYMNDGINEYEKRHTYIQDASGKVDIAIKNGQEKLSEEANAIFSKYEELINTLYLRTETTTKQLAEKYDAQAESLHKAIIEKLSDVRQLENELKNLVSVKVGIANLEKATNEQNRKIENLTSAIHELAQVKVTGGTASVAMKMPKLYKVLFISVSAVVSVTALFFIVVQILSLLGVM